MSSRPVRARSGFTLIELVATVAIIGLLVGLLMPALEHVRESARHAVCMSNQHQLGIALFSHAHNHGDKLPALQEVEQAFPTSILVCPSDPRPDIIPAGLFGNAEPLSLSYAVNNEYEHYSVLLSRVPSASEKAFLYDGVQAIPGGAPGSAPGSASASAPASSASPFAFGGIATASATSPFATLTLASNGAIAVDVDADATDTVVDYVGDKFVWITHVPPGNYQAARMMRISINGLPGHLSHGDVIGPLGDGVNSDADLQRSRFVRRHLAHTTGNVLMLDGHVAAVRQLEDNMFLNLDALFSGGGGNNTGHGHDDDTDDDHPGNGNGGGNNGNGGKGNGKR